jgi:hypothetical protein
MTQLQSECVYCGTKGKLTADHIPPKSLFAPPRPAILITVPSCLRCNKAASQDDEYFKAVLALKETAGDHPDAKGVRESVLRSLARPQSRRFSRYFLNRTARVNVHTPAGLYVGKRLSYDVDLERLDRVAARVVKGLFYALKGKRIPQEYMVVAHCEDGLQNLSAADQETLRQTVVIPVLSGTQGTVANNVMKYWVAFEPTNEYVSAWILEFYLNVRFLVFVIPTVQLNTA